MPVRKNEKLKLGIKKRVPYYGRGSGRGGHLNSPSLAYKAVHGKAPKEFLSGKTGHPQKLWKNIPVDKEIKVKWLKKLNTMKDIEMRGSCSGHGPNRTSYIVFRLPPKQDKYAKKVAKRLNKMRGVYSISDVGSEGRPRIVVASKTWHGHPGWENWWNNLPSRIEKNVVNLNKK